MPLLQLSLLGGFACRSPSGPVALPTRKVRALVAYLATAAGHRHGRDKLAALLWSDQPDGQARANLRKALSRLRASLPGRARRCLVADPRDVALEPDALDVDACAFERLAAERTPETLERASALYRGALLEGLGDCGPVFEEWLGGERRRYEELFRQVLQRLLDHYVVTGAIDPAIQVALRLLALDPLQEGVHRALIRLYMQQDRVGSALDQYRRCREVLSRELGVAPGAETERLHAELQSRLPPGPAGAVGGPPRERDDLPERAAVIHAAADARARRRAAASGRPSVAVLSFTGAGEAVERYLGDGVAEDLATDLGRFRELDVIAPAASLAYGEAAVSPERAGGELGADYLVDGGLRRTATGLRLTVRLIDVDTGRQLWAERYDTPLEQVADMQDDLVRRIVGTLVGQVEAARLEGTRRQRPEDWQAYDLWLRGWRALKRPDLAAIREARAYFQQALAKDRRFSRAYVGLALAHLSEWACFSWSHWTLLQAEALDLARQAVALDARDHRARCMLALAHLYGRRHDAARREILTALELNPNDADVLAHAACCLALIGEHDLGVEAGRRALRLSPYHPEWYAAFAGIALFTARRYDEAIATLAPAPEAICDTPAFMAAAYAQLGATDRCASYRDTVVRHHRQQLARGAFPEGTSCVQWLLELNPYRLPEDVEHFVAGLRKAGFC